jgi:DNA modification methylase
MSVSLLVGDCRSILSTIDAGSAHCCVTSPPYYGLRDYGIDTQLGLEPSPDEYVQQIVKVFSEVKRILRDDGTLWLNLGDSTYSGNGQPTGSDEKSPNRNWRRRVYHWLDRPGAGIPKKSLLGIPWRVAHALQADGWTLRQEIIWCRPTAFVEPSVTDRPLRQHETIFLLSKSRRYWFDRSSLPEESVWHIEPERAVKQHIAPYPVELARRCIKAGCPEGGVVLDPFCGSGTTGIAAVYERRKALLIEVSPSAAGIARTRLGLFASPPSPCPGEGQAPVFFGDGR